MDAIGYNLGVGFRGERVTQADQFLTQAFVIFNDAVMHQRQGFSLCDMWMGIAFTGHAMGGPSGMGNTRTAKTGAGLKRLLQSRDLAMRPHPADFSVCAQQGDPGRIVTAIFKPTQALQQDRHYIALGDRSNYSTHKSPFLFVIYRFFSRDASIRVSRSVAPWPRLIGRRAPTW